MTVPQRMSQSPEPAKAPGQVTIHYDTTGCTFPIHLVVYIDPGIRKEVWIEDVEHASFPVTLPENATGGQIIDLSDQSLMFTIIIEP